MTSPISEVVKSDRTTEIIQSMQSRMLWFPLNEQTAMTQKDKTVEAAGNTSLFTANRASFSADLRSYGAATNEWSDALGWFAPQGANSALGQGDSAGGAAVRINGPAETGLHTFMDLSTLDGVGGMLVMADYQTDTAPASTEYLYAYGVHTATAREGGHYINLYTSSGIGISAAIREYNATTQYAAGTTGIAVDTRLKIAGYFDVLNDTLYSYIYDGAGTYSVASQSGPGTGKWPQDSTTADHANTSGLSILCANGATPQSAMGISVGVPQVRNLQFIRFEYDASGIWQQLVEDAYDNPFELSENFRGI